MEQDAEIWLPIRDYEGYYEVSNCGRVRALARTIIFVNGYSRRFAARDISTNALVSGYRSCALWRDNVGERVLVHRLVLEAFVGPAPFGWECRHKNGDRLNATLSNLCWGTSKENGEDRVAHGMQARHEQHGMAKLSKEDVSEIRVLLKTKKQSEIARVFGVNPSVISRIKTGNAWAGV
jgi:hypothetical protein